MRHGLFVKLQTDYYTDAKMIRVGPWGSELYNRACCLAQDKESDGMIWKEQIPIITVGFEDEAQIAKVIELLTTPLVPNGKPLWTPVEGGWRITAFLKHNRCSQEIETLRDKRRAAGKAGAEKRWQHGKVDSTCHNTDIAPLSMSMSMSSSESICSSSGSGSCSEGKEQPNPGTETAAPVPQIAHADDGSKPENNDGLYTPDDPLYKFDPRYDASVDLDYWQKTIGKIQPAQLILASNTLTRLHNFCRRSKREIRALIKFVGTDKDAKRFWGKPGSSPLGWLRSTDGGEPTWIKIRAAWLAAGGSLPMARQSKLGPAPAIDYDCGCRRGWIENDKQETQPCPKCDFGKWLLAGGRL